MSTANAIAMDIRRPRIKLPVGSPVPPRRAPRARVPHVITVTSGKGGVGKTNFTANLGWQLRQIRRNVMILDADLGLANIDIILGLTPDFNISHVLSGEKSLDEIITRGPGGLRVLPAGSGVSGMTELTDAQKLTLLAQMEALEQNYDFFLIDTGAGIASNVIYFTLAAQTMIVMVTPEPTSLTDAYALIKVLSRDYHQRRFKIVANDVGSEAEGDEVFQNLTRVTDRFLDVSLDYLGHIPHDPNLRHAVRLQRPCCEAFPEAPAARAMRQIARRISELKNDPLNSDLGLLWRNVLIPEGTA